MNKAHWLQIECKLRYFRSDLADIRASPVLCHAHKSICLFYHEAAHFVHRGCNFRGLSGHFFIFVAIMCDPVETDYT